jgi:hypothetical protein
MSVSSLKRAAQHSFPWLYYTLWRARDAIDMRFNRERWAFNFDGEDDNLKMPTRCALELAPFVPDYVDTVLIIGCAPGRDFKPFQDRMRLWGIDVAPFERIKHWHCNVAKLRYEHLSLQAFTDRLSTSPVDLSRTVAFVSLVLCYISQRYQRRFFDALRANGCRNIIFQDFPKSDPKCGGGRPIDAFICQTASSLIACGSAILRVR